jgi:predicted transposase YdaD
MDHDGMFKQLLRTFFIDFLELFVPRVLEDLDQSSIEFIDKEIITDVAARERHEVDLLVKARFRGKESFFLIHVETQASAQEDFARRMFQYFARLYETYGLPIYPIVIFSYDSPAREEPDSFTVNVSDLEVLVFRFRVIQLNRLKWRDFLARPSPVAAALMTKMQIPKDDRPRVMRECLRMLATLKLDLARQSLIVDFMNAYLKLSAEEWIAYNREVQVLEQPERKAIMQIVDQFEIRGEAKGLVKGEVQGLAKMALLQLRTRFTTVPSAVETRVRELDREQLEALGVALLDFTSLADVQAWLSQQPEAAKAD